VVDAYVDDPLCGYACSLGYYRNFFRALQESWKAANIRKMPSQLPVLLLGGSMDPAIRFGKDTRLLKERYETLGLENVKVKLFKNGRHEMLNERNRMEVFGYLKEWMAAVGSRQ
jgi:alpha-beta hydrolase superfamily lysophospholipase